MTQNRRSQIALSLFGLFVFVLCLWAIHNQLRQYNPREVLDSLAAIPYTRLLLSVGCAMMGYSALTGYDFLAFRYLRYALKPRAIALTAFISYAISNNVGLPIFTGGALRYRLYSGWGVPAKAIAKIIAFGNLSFWLGLFAVSGTIFLIDPLPVPSLLNLPFVSVRPLGVIFVAIAFAYLLASLRHRRSLRIGNEVLSFPSFPFSLAQISVSLVDWGFEVAVLYLLLPPHLPLSYFGFAGIYLLGMTAGIVSSVPGGLGVFEMVILILLPQQVPTPAVLGSLLAYRGIYYLLPLMVATGLLGGYEIRQRLKPRSIPNDTC